MARILAIDYGKKRTGLALGRNGLTAILTAIDSKDTIYALNELAKIIALNKVEVIVFGLPLDAEGKDTAMSIEVRTFANSLKRKIKKNIQYVNEFQSSVEATEDAISSGLSKKGRKSVDSISAGIILKRYFENLDTE